MKPVPPSLSCAAARTDHGLTPCCMVYVQARAAPTTVQSSFAKGVSLRAPRAAAVSTQRVSLSVVAGESRIGKNPCKVPAGVTVTLKEQHLSVKVRPCLSRRVDDATDGLA